MKMGLEILIPQGWTGKGIVHLLFSTFQTRSLTKHYHFESQKLPRIHDLMEQMLFQVMRWTMYPTTSQKTFDDPFYKQH